MGQVLYTQPCFINYTTVAFLEKWMLIKDDIPINNGIGRDRSKLTIDSLYVYMYLLYYILLMWK